jgi:hypothetical protein
MTVVEDRFQRSNFLALAASSIQIKLALRVRLGWDSGTVQKSPSLALEYVPFFIIKRVLILIFFFDLFMGKRRGNSNYCPLLL